MTKYSINLKSLLYLILGYSFITPYYIGQIEGYSMINNLIIIVSFVIIFLLYIVNPSNITLNQGFIWILIYFMVILILNIYNQSLNAVFFRAFGLIIGFALLVSHSLRSKKEFVTFIGTISFLIYLYAIINIVIVFIYPDGIPSILQSEGKRYYLFGNVNASIRILLPGLLFTFLYDSLKFKQIRKRSWLLLLIVWVTLIKTWTVTAMLGLIIFTVIMLIKLGKKQLFIAYIVCLFGSIIITILLVFLNYEVNVLASVLDFFEKDLTFSSRDILWINAVDSIRESPIFGYGYQTEDVTRFYIGNAFGAHNYYIDTLFRGGILAIIILVIGLTYFGRLFIKSNNNTVSRTLIATSCAYFVMWIAEPFITNEYLMFSVLFVLIPNLNTLQRFSLEKTE